MPKAFVLLQYPDFIERQLLEFGKIEWRIDEYEKLKRAYNNKIGAICARSIVLKKGFMFFRARFTEKQGMQLHFDLNEKDLFCNVKELGINSRERTRSFGRAHTPGNPVLYTSFRPETAIHEMAQWVREQYKINELLSRGLHTEDEASKAGEVVTEGYTGWSDADRDFILSWGDDQGIKNLVVSAWELQEDMLFTYFFVKEEGFLPEEIKIHIERMEAISLAWETPDKKYMTKSLKLIEDFFAYEFVKTDIRNNEDYMLSALGADLAFSYIRDTKVGDEKYAKSAGILYASVAEGHQGVNCVITAEAVAAGKIKFVSAALHCVMRPEYDLFGEEIKEKKFHSIMAGAELVSEETGDLVWQIFKTEYQQPDADS